MVTNNGPPERLVGQDANGSNLYAWRRNSGGSPQNVHPDISDHIPNANQLPQGSTASPDQRGKCAEPAALTDYRNWLAKQPNPGDATMLNRIQQGVVAVVPMNKGGPTSGSYKAPCDFCGPTLNNMGLSNRVMTPQAVAQAMPNIAQVFTIQNVPVFR
ncbi:YwqJ-related putative deaminase [Sorangium sp. So ce321]|uniref:YwqJ-related putative deaminase n=1 Tax=Sorangium sp. So ce321 TaxID=3133300 RepID=UPI003F5F2112